MSEQDAECYTELAHNTGLRIVGLIIAWQILDVVLDPVHTLFLNILYPGAGYH